MRRAFTLIELLVVIAIMPSRSARAVGAARPSRGRRRTCSLQPTASSLPLAAFTLIELLVVIAIIAVLAALLLPALDRAQDSAHTVACMGNQRQLFTAFNLYGTDYATYPNIGFPYHGGGVHRVATLGWTEYYPGICIAWPQYNTHLYPYVGAKSEGLPYVTPVGGAAYASEVPEIFHCPGDRAHSGQSNRHGTLYFVPPYSGYCIPCGCYEFGSAKLARDYYSGGVDSPDKRWLISDGVLWNRGAAASWTWECPSTGSGCAYYCYLVDGTRFPKSQAHDQNRTHMTLHANGSCEPDHRSNYAGMNVYGYVIPDY